MRNIIKSMTMLVVVIGVCVSYCNVLALKKMTAPTACHSDERITIAAVGDVLLHLPLQKKASYSGFQSLWQDSLPYIQSADIAFANIEGPMAYGVSKSGKLVKDPGNRADGDVYSSYPLFNYHPSLASSLKKSGFDIVSTANNHSLDRRSVGVDRTIKVLQNAGLTFTGTRAKNDDDGKWYAITERKGFRLAWISCTGNTNGINDRYKQVLYCYKKADKKLILSMIHKLRRKVDGIVVAPHWGKQYEHRVSKRQKKFAIDVLEAGAAVVIGSHPHVVQPVKRYRTKDGRNTLVAYSLGNFVSFQGTPKNRSTIILYLSLQKTKSGVEISKVQYVPMYMQNRNGLKKIHLSVLSAKDKKSVGHRILSKVLSSKKMVYQKSELQSAASCTAGAAS